MIKNVNRAQVSRSA